MLHVPQTAGAASKVVLLSFGFSCPCLSLLVVFSLLCCCARIALFCLSHLRGGTTPLFYFAVLYCFIILLFFLFLCPFRFSLCQRIWIASFCMYVSYWVRWHAIALSTLLIALQCSISVSWFCNHRTCISLGGRIGTYKGCAGCQRVERTV